MPADPVERLRSLLVHWDWLLGRPQNLWGRESIRRDPVARLRWTGYVDWDRYDPFDVCLRRPKHALATLAPFLVPGGLVHWYQSVDNAAGAYYAYVTWHFDGDRLIEMGYRREWDTHPLGGDW